MTTPRAEQQFSLSKLLTDMAESMLEKPKGRLADETIRQLPVAVKEQRNMLLDEDDVRLIDFEAQCLLELMIGLDHAKQVGDIAKIDFIAPLMWQFIGEMRADFATARRARPQ